MTRKIRIEVPATSANLGPGFDTLGLALDIVDTIHVEFDPDDDEVCLSETSGLDLELHEKENLLCRAYHSWPSGREARLPGARFRLESRIPVGKGLGSSAASIVAGLTAATAAANVKDPHDRIVQLASLLEPHPDNIVAATLGGMTVAFRDGDTIRALHVANHLSLGIAIFVPHDQLLTSEARAVLPDDVPIGDAVFNIGRAAYLATALMWGKWESIAPAMQDRLHQPYRAQLLPHMDAVIASALESGAYGAAMSGGGPSIIALVPVDRSNAIAAAMQSAAQAHGWIGESLVTRVRQMGAVVYEDKDESR